MYYTCILVVSLFCPVRKMRELTIRMSGNAIFLKASMESGKNNKEKKKLN